ncbi:hypothetical protein NHX12_021157 [Muraenolepis orangiensis]|uniref:Ferric-chelate reductase 1 n=1 Tax=Muraenolepis orangiensis TaxID=630683 RepID=A0A9Q0IVV2_9TELE|nr:hypothetical protein NHX12_021157 [Muraenolepis orangiensis]
MKQHPCVVLVALVAWCVGPAAGYSNVTLQVSSSHGSSSFRGFLLEARDAADPRTALGSFSLLQPDGSQLLNCGGTQGSGVSHRNGSKKARVQAVWECPLNPPQRVQFFATVVQKYKLFWVQIPGPVVSGCGVTKSCLREPAGCSPERDQSCVFLSFSRDPTGDTVLFELSGPAEGYVAFALSLDKWMGNDDVYLCAKDNDRVNINAAYLSGRTHPELAEEEALQDKAWALSDGVIRCRFRRDVLVPQMETRFCLDQSHFLFLAHGRAPGGSILRHDRQPLISSDRVLISGPPVDLSGSRSPLILKFHGVVMLVAWLWMVSSGVLFARHFRPMWPDVLLCGDQLWFQVHRGLMALAVGLICVAFTLPFIYRGGWSKHAGYHPLLGCTVLALSVIQPLIAVFRPAPNARRRYLFNWLHRSMGTLLQVLAVMCIFLGFQQQALLLTSHGVATGALVGWILWILLADLGLLFHSVCSTRTSTGPPGKEDKEDLLLAEPSDNLWQREVYKFKKMVMIVFQIGNVLFLGVLMNAIINV